MKQLSFEIFFILGIIFLVSAILRFLFQKIKLADFIAYTGVGMFIGFMADRLSNYSEFAEILRLESNPLWQLLLFVGILFYFARLISNFDSSFLNLNLKNNLSLVFIYVSIFALSLLAYVFLFNANLSWKTVVLMGFALLPINIGPIMGYGFPGVPKIKTELILLLQIAVWIDLLVILFFAVGHSILLVANSPWGLATIIDFSLFLFIIILFILFIQFGRSVLNEGKMNPGTVFLIFNGLLFFLIAYGSKIGFSPILIGIIIGWGIKQFTRLDQSQFLKFQEYVEKYFILLLFVEMGRLFVLNLDFDIQLLQDSGILLLFILVAVVLFSIVLILRTKLSSKHIIGLAARGELSLVIVWILLTNNLLQWRIWGIILISVLISAIFIQYYYLILKNIRVRKSI